MARPTGALTLLSCLRQRAADHGRAATELRIAQPPHGPRAFAILRAVLAAAARTPRANPLDEEPIRGAPGTPRPRLVEPTRPLQSWTPTNVAGDRDWSPRRQR